MIIALRSSTEKDPLLLLEEIMDLPSVHMHGPEHHAIVPSVLLTALRNNGERMNYDTALSEICKRAKQVPVVPAVTGECVVQQQVPESLCLL